MHTLAIRTDPVEPRRVLPYHAGPSTPRRGDVDQGFRCEYTATWALEWETPETSDARTQSTMSEANGRTKTSSEFADLFQDSTLDAYILAVRHLSRSMLDK